VSDIFLVRHGEAAAEWGQHEDPGLSRQGLRQAEQAAGELLDLLPAPCQLLSSPRRRALETAKPLAEHLARKIVVDRHFCEIPAPVPLEHRKPWLRAFMGQVWADQPATLRLWRSGILDALHQVSEPTVVFTHFLVINSVVGAVQGRDETLSFWPDNGSITRLSLADGALRLVALGREMPTVVN